MPHDPDFERAYQEAVTRVRAFSDSLAGPSLIERLIRLPREDRDAILASLSTFDLARLSIDWATWARPKQDPDLSEIEHRIVFFLAGRGFGKSLAGAQRVRRRVLAGARSIAIVGPTLADVEKYMIGGKGGADGLLSVFPKHQKPEWRAHKRELIFHTGAIGYINTAEEPEFRGSNLDTVWADEPCKWRYLDTLWTNIELSTRLPGVLPLELIITSSPVPVQVFKEWIADPDTVTIIGATRENATNTDPKWQAKMQAKLGGTRLGRQELEGEILDDNPDALFLASRLDVDRVEEEPSDLVKAISIDPAIATGRTDNDDTGVLVGGIDSRGHIYILADLTRERAKPEVWGADVVKAYEDHKATAIVSERNRGGDLVAANIRAMMERRRGGVAAKNLKIVEVHAVKGKALRAEPVSALHERGLIHIVGHMPALEGELTTWNPKVGGVSPNRLDAFVWLVWYLARLGEDEETPKDYRPGFRGLSEAQKRLGGGVTEARSMAAALPRSAWGSKL